MKDVALHPCANCPASATPPLSTQSAKEKLGSTILFCITPSGVVLSFLSSQLLSVLHLLTFLLALLTQVQDVG